jgi:hypothetical protein
MWAKELRENELLRVVLFDVMEAMHPARYAIPGDGNNDVSPVRAGIELGLTRGYSKYGDLLRLLAQRKTRRADVGEPDYAAPVLKAPEPQK